MQRFLARRSGYLRRHGGHRYLAAAARRGHRGRLQRRRTQPEGVAERARLRRSLAGALQLGAGNGAASDAAATYFNANVPGKLTGDAGQVPTTKFWVDGTTLYGTAAYQVPTSFMRLATISSLPVGATSGAVMGTKGIELALVLDVSSSMEDNNKIGSLQAAASALVNIIYSDHPDTTGGVTTRANTYISIVPFDGRVNTQKYNANWLNANPPARCTKPRAVNVANDAPPSVETFTPTPPQMLVKHLPVGECGLRYDGQGDGLAVDCGLRRQMARSRAMAPRSGKARRGASGCCRPNGRTSGRRCQAAFECRWTTTRRPARSP